MTEHDVDEVIAKADRYLWIEPSLIRTTHPMTRFVRLFKGHYHVARRYASVLQAMRIAWLLARA